MTKLIKRYNVFCYVCNALWGVLRKCDYVEHHNLAANCVIMLRVKTQLNGIVLELCFDSEYNHTTSGFNMSVDLKMCIKLHEKCVIVIMHHYASSLILSSPSYFYYSVLFVKVGVCARVFFVLANLRTYHHASSFNIIAHHGCTWRHSLTVMWLLQFERSWVRSLEGELKMNCVREMSFTQPPVVKGRYRQGEGKPSKQSTLGNLAKSWQKWPGPIT